MGEMEPEQLGKPLFSSLTALLDPLYSPAERFHYRCARGREY